MPGGVRARQQLRQLTFYRLATLRAMSKYQASAGSPANPDRVRPGEQVRKRRNPVLRRCLAITTKHFRRPGRSIDSRAVEALADLTLGFGYKARRCRGQKILSTSVRTAAEGQSGNRPRAADVKDFPHATTVAPHRGFHQRWAAASTEPRSDIPQYAPASPASAPTLRRA